MFDKFKFACIGATGIIFIASYFFVGVHYYRTGYETATKKYDEVLRVESEKNYQKIIETERTLTDKQNAIVSEYLKYIDDLEKQHEQDKIDMDNLRDVISIDADKLCPRLTWIICVMLSVLTLTSCATTPIPTVQPCPQKPQINPNLNVIQKANYSERLKKVWVLQTNATN